MPKPSLKTIILTANRAQYLGPAVLLLAAACLYLFTLDNGLRPDELTGGDLITHQYAQVEARPSNAPGYPLYTMGGWMWFHGGKILLGWALNPIQILSLYSTLWGLASLLLLYLILLRLTRPLWPLAFLLTAFYAVTYFFWYYSVTTEQYSSAVCQTLLLIWLAWRWDDRPRDSLLLGLALICGTMLANMVTTLFILPPLLWFILSKKERPALLKPKLILQIAGLGLLPLLSYSYVFTRGAMHPEWRGADPSSNTWAWFINFLTIPQGRDELAPGLSLQNFFTAEFPSLLWHELTWPIFLGGLIGLAFLSRRRAVFLYSTLVIYLIFCWLYRFGNWFQVIIPAYPIFIIGCAAVLRRISESANQRKFTNYQSTVHYSLFTVYLFALALLTGLLLYRLTTNLPRADQRDLPGDIGLDPGWVILADRPQRPAVISVDFPERVALQYLQTVWERGEGLYLSASPGDFTSLAPVGQVGNLSYYITRRAAAATPETVLALKNLPFQEIYPQAAGEQLILLAGQPLTQRPGAVPWNDVPFGDTLRLVGWEQIQTNFPLPPEVSARLQRANWQIALYWRVTQTWDTDYIISVRPRLDNKVMALNEATLIQDHQPVWGLYPTSRWRPGELVRDVYALRLPEGATVETVQIVVYKTTADGFENVGEQILAVK
ncbi:MAG: DUF2723 domain-containing protein [Anaerolineae bacterium]